MKIHQTSIQQTVVLAIVFFFYFHFVVSVFSFFSSKFNLIIAFLFTYYTMRLITISLLPLGQQCNVSQESIHHARMNVSATLKIHIRIAAHRRLKRCIQIILIRWTYKEAYIFLHNKTIEKR